MIAIVSSTIHPSLLSSHDGARSTLSPEDRLEQTQGTVASLLALGVREIIVADNSAGPWLRHRSGELSPARVLHFDHPHFKNKGIGELWLLISALQSLPEGETIIKISGRYRVGTSSGLLPAGDDDVAGKVTGTGLAAQMSTRCYLVRNREVAARFWERALDELYAERSRIVGPRSFARIVRNSLRPADDPYRYSDPNTLSLEQASHRAIRNLGLRFRPVESLAVEGILGSWVNPPIKE